MKGRRNFSVLLIFLISLFLGALHQEARSQNIPRLRHDIRASGYPCNSVDFSMARERTRERNFGGTEYVVYCDHKTKSYIVFVANNGRAVVDVVYIR